jgi:hypothetical protein
VIKFEGEEFGPYRSQAEAMLFAIDATQKRGQQDEPTEVLLIGDAGEVEPAWVYGHPPIRRRSNFPRPCRTVRLR